MKRTPLPPRRKPLRSVSPKTAARDRRYRVGRLAFLRARPRCEARWDAGCTGWSQDVHHMAGRAPSVFFDESLWLPACRHCHDELGRHPWEAMARGLSVSRHTRRAS